MSFPITRLIVAVAPAVVRRAPAFVAPIPSTATCPPAACAPARGGGGPTLAGKRFSRWCRASPSPRWPASEGGRRSALRFAGPGPCLDPLPSVSRGATSASWRSP